MDNYRKTEELNWLCRAKEAHPTSWWRASGEWKLGLEEKCIYYDVEKSEGKWLLLSWESFLTHLESMSRQTECPLAPSAWKNLDLSKSWVGKWDTEEKHHRLSTSESLIISSLSLGEPELNPASYLFIPSRTVLPSGLLVLALQAREFPG